MYKIVTLGLMMTIFTVQQSSAEITLPVPVQNNEINESGYINVPSSQQKNSSKDDSHLLKKPSEASTSYSEGYTKLPSPPSTKIPQIAPKVEIKMRAGVNAGKTLLDPMVAELPNFIDAGGVANNLLTGNGILKILQAGGKIKRDFVNVENLSNTIKLGNS